MILHVRERKQLYAFLVGLFSYPDRDLAAALDSGEGAVMARLLPGTPSPPAPSPTIGDLETAFTDLFINRLGGAPAPPYGSVYLERERILMGETTLQVAEAYRAAGLILEGNGELPDFLPTELEFLYFLVEQEEQALGRRDPAAARALVARQADFCRDFLHPWVPVFCDRLQDDSRTPPLYRWGAELLRSFCRQERDWLTTFG